MYRRSRQRILRQIICVAIGNASGSHRWTALKSLCLGLLQDVDDFDNSTLANQGSQQTRIAALQRLTAARSCFQETKTKFLGQPIYVAIREVSRQDRKITLNMVEATQRLAYRNLRVSAPHLCLAPLPCTCDFFSCEGHHLTPPLPSNPCLGGPARAAISTHAEHQRGSCFASGHCRLIACPLCLPELTSEWRSSLCENGKVCKWMHLHRGLALGGQGLLFSSGSLDDSKLHAGGRAGLVLCQADRVLRSPARHREHAHLGAAAYLGHQPRARGEPLGECSAAPLQI